MLSGSSAQLVSLALGLYQRNQPGAAARVCREIIARDPEHAEAFHVLGSLDCARHRWQAALGSFRAAVRLRPREARYRNGAAIVLWKLGRRQEAIEEIARGLQYAPRDAELRVNHARFLARAGDPQMALDALDRALAAAPRRYDLVLDAARSMERSRRYADSERCWRMLLDGEPRHPEATLGLAGVLNRQGRIDDALPLFRMASRMPEVRDTAQPSLLLSLHYSEREKPSRIFLEHRAWARRVEPGIPPAPHVRRSKRMLRVGYLSGDFRLHSTAHFVEPLLAHHDRARFQVHCFSNVPHPDRITARFQRLAAAWHSIDGLADDQAADLIRREHIDILVDLSGHTAHSRLPVFALRPAPVQVTYLGYPDTTGLRSMDYRFTDSIADPPGTTEHLHSETLVRLDPCFLCYRPWIARMPVGDPAFAARGFVTLAAMAIREKLSPSILEAWAEILRRAPRVRLLIKCAAISDTHVRKELRAFFEVRGIARRRLTLADSVRTMEAHLEWYRHIDLMLDTYPYNGTTLTCESLWMGTPVVTWAGDTHVSRVGADLLTQVSLEDLIAHSSAAYVDQALDAIRSRGRLAEWRRSLRARMRRSPLMDAPRLARNVEAAYRAMWRA